MKRSTFSALCRCLAAACLLSSPVCAQSTAAATGVPVRLNIDVGENATLSDVVELLLGRYRSAGEPVNVVFTQREAGSRPVQPMSLQQVTFDQAMKALERVVFGPGLSFRGEGSLFVIDSTTGLHKVRVFNISEFLRPGGLPPAAQGGGEMEDKRRLERLKGLLKAIDHGVQIGMKVATWPMDQPKIEIEDETGLLFATGGPDELEIVADVVRALCDPHASLAPKARP